MGLLTKILIPSLIYFGGGGGVTLLMELHSTGLQTACQASAGSFNRPFDLGF